ncbi:hypothetical protein Avbf_14634 [Armadillidium vulgare]|nr:hypothetical protein Avbf_14634 [Armadillidium vulgare]
MIPVYLFEDEFFSGYQYYPTSDLFIHLIFLIFWFCAAITWTAGEANLRVSTSRENVLELNEYKFDCDENGINKCTVEPPDNYTKAVVSVVPDHPPTEEQYSGQKKNTGTSNYQRCLGTSVKRTST